MDFLSLAWTEPYLMSLNPANSMDVAFLARESVVRAALKYTVDGQTRPALEAERFSVEGLHVPAREDGWDPEPENNPLLHVRQFIFHITGLTPGARVTYQISAEDDNGLTAVCDPYEFRAAPPDGEPFAFALISDLQSFKPCDHTLYQLGKRDFDFMLYAGDMANRCWHATDWFTVPGAWQPEYMKGMAFFDIMQRRDSGIRLMQYRPIFPCPGNHESDDNRTEGRPDWAVDKSRYSWRIYMQLFRTYYPDQEYGWNGKHWYSTDYSGLHIVSSMVVRCNMWNPFDAPGTILQGGEPGPDTPQGRWLTADLEASQKPLKWVVMHWHMMNRGDDTQPLLCQPEPDPDNPGKVVYPRDNAGQFLHPLFARTGVCGVSYGHSHVYERYLIDGVHYIEAAYFGIKYGKPDGQVNPSGILPVSQQHDFRSFMIVSSDGKGLRARAYQASVESCGCGFEGRVFDEFVIR